MISKLAKPLILLALISCSQEPEVRQNPLLNVNAEDLGRLAHDWAKQTPNIKLVDGCMNYWREASRDEIPANFIEPCESIAIDFAATLASAGYGDVQSHDVYLPPIWSHYLGARQRSLITGSNITFAERRLARKAESCRTEVGRSINRYTVEECEQHLRELEAQDQEP